MYLGLISNLILLTSTFIYPSQKTRTHTKAWKPSRMTVWSSKFLLPAPMPFSSSAHQGAAWFFRDSLYGFCWKSSNSLPHLQMTLPFESILHGPKFIQEPKFILKSVEPRNHISIKRMTLFYSLLHLLARG